MGFHGSIACIIPKIGYVEFRLTPAIQALDYTQEIKYINRIDHVNLKKWFEYQIEIGKKYLTEELKPLVILERPMVNPQRFNSSKIALRAFESTLIVLELLNLDYIIIDSKKWQHYFFGKNTSLIDLKYESQKRGIEVIDSYGQLTNKDLEKCINNELITEMKNIMVSHGDGDSLLMCEYAIQELI